MKKIIFDGRIGANGAEVRATNGGKPYVRFSVANNSFVNSQETTEWFDVTSYDPHVIENRIKSLTKGTYVIISGQLNTKTNVKDNKVWVNQYVTAESIDIPYLGKKNDENSDVQEIKKTIVSDTEDDVTTFTKPLPQKPTKPKQEEEVQYVDESQDEDLPF